MIGQPGYILAQFLFADVNRRDDGYGECLENRARLLFEIIDGTRSTCRPDFQLGLRLSPERFGMRLGEILELTAEILRQAKIDYLDMSLWNVSKKPEDEAHKGTTLLGHLRACPAGWCAWVQRAR